MALVVIQTSAEITGTILCMYLYPATSLCLQLSMHVCVCMWMGGWAVIVSSTYSNQLPFYCEHFIVNIEKSRVDYWMTWQLKHPFVLESSVLSAIDISLINYKIILWVIDKKFFITLSIYDVRMEQLSKRVWPTRIDGNSFTKNDLSLNGKGFVFEERQSLFRKRTNIPVIALMCMYFAKSCHLAFCDSKMRHSYQQI